MMNKDDKLTLKIWETPLGFFAYAVYDGDGTVPGSLHAAAGAMDLSTAFKAGQKDLERSMKIRSCDHDWSLIFGANVPQCSKCEIVNWKE
jgi:hypothetical protein